MHGEYGQILHRLVPVFGDVFAHDIFVSGPSSYRGTGPRHDGHVVGLRCSKRYASCFALFMTAPIGYYIEPSLNDLNCKFLHSHTRNDISHPLSRSPPPPFALIVVI